MLVEGPDGIFQQKGGRFGCYDRGPSVVSGSDGEESAPFEFKSWPRGTFWFINGPFQMIDVLVLLQEILLNQVRELFATILQFREATVSETSVETRFSLTLVVP
jgi:hypothetical protein